MNGTPTFTLLTPVYHPPLGHFIETIDSVVQQAEPSWEMICVFDGTHEREYRSAIEGFQDPRLRIVERPENGGISAASNDGLAVAQGTYVGLLDHDDTLASFALSSIRESTEHFPDADVFYSDEDKLDLDGSRTDIFCKPQFSPEWLRCHMYLGHLCVYRRSILEEIGGFRPEFDGAQDHDLALRATEKARRVVHIPRILYHWRKSATSTAADPESKSWAYDAGVRAVAAAVERQGVQATAVRRPGFSGIVELEPRLVAPPKVSIVIPTAGGERTVIGERFRMINRCLQSIQQKSTYPDYEVVVVVDGLAPESVERELAREAMPNLRTARNHRPFNFSEACNLGRDHSTGDVLVFLNDDTEVITENWMERLVMFSILDGVGAVGVKLVYSDGRIQHLGLVARDGMGHRRVGVPGDEAGPFSSYTVPTNVLSVTGACLAVTTERFDAVGGFATQFPLAFNDIDLCMKLYRAGFRTVLDPLTVVMHHESSTRDPTVSPAEFDDLFARWRPLLENDPYDNPHLNYGGMNGVEQIHPPASFIQLKELLGRDIVEPRPWPPE